MRLVGKERSRFDLRIAGYQFPTNTWNWDDANWLVVKIRVKSPQGSWRASEPCLQTDEADRLAKWFADLSVGSDTEREIDFMEPLLVFRNMHSTPERVVLRVFFWLEFLPPWQSYHQVGEEDVWIELDVPRAAFGRAASSLRKDLAKSPWRYPDRPDLRPRFVTPKGRVLSDHAAGHVTQDEKP